MATAAIRIYALMWVMSMAPLVYAATEYLMSKAMDNSNLSISWTGRRVMLNRLTLIEGSISSTTAVPT